MSTFRTMDGGRPIYWQDKAGVTHSCEAAEVHPGVRLIWTDCQRDVPANQAYLPGDKDICPDCPKCKRAPPRASDGPGEEGV